MGSTGGWRRQARGEMAPRGEALFRCARPSGVPRGPATSTGPKPMSIESVMPSSHLILCCPLFLLPPIPPSIRVFSNESTLRMRWPKYWSFSFSIGVAFQAPPGSQASSRGEAKDSALLSSRDAALLEPPAGPLFEGNPVGAGIEPGSPTLQTDALPSKPPGKLIG